MKKKIASVFFAIASFLFQLPIAWADSSLEGELLGFRVSLDDNGQEQLVSADKAQPGDVIEYRLAYHNNTELAVDAVVVTGPVPANTAYVAGSSSGNVPHRQLVSIDGGESFDTEPVKRVVSKPDGSHEEFVVPPSEYTHLRWLPQSPVGQGSNLVFRYRVRIL